MIFNRTLLTVLGAVVLIGCSGAATPPEYGGGGPGGGAGPGGQPDWVDGQSSRYPDLQYLRGVGHAPTRGACDASARAALAKIFNAQIHQESQDWQGHFSKVSSLGHSVRVEAMSISQLTRVSTDKVLKGTNIADHWQGEGVHHCLALLERFPAANSLRDEITRLDGEIRAKVEEGDGAPNVTARFMAYARAMEVMQEREALNVDLRIVDPRGVGVTPPVSWAELVAKFTGSKAQIKVGLRLTGTQASKIQTCLAEQLGEQGLQILEGTSDVDVMIHGKLHYEKAGVIHGSHMVRTTVTLRLADMESGKTLAAYTEFKKVGRPSLEQAVQLSVFKLCQQVVPKLTQKIRASFGR